MKGEMFMSFPNIPDIDANIDISREEALNLLLASVAFEELGLAHIINAEGEKIQYLLGTLNEERVEQELPTIDDLIAINKSVEKTLQTVIKNQMLLQFKLEDIVEEIIVPLIDIKKYVSIDNGVTWNDANTSPGPTLVSPTNPKFKLVITNTGNVTLTGVSVTDSDLGPISIGGILPPGASFSQVLTGTFALGQQSNIATVTGVYNGESVQDSDIAYYFGVQQQD